MKTLEDRFWAKVNKADKCWVWEGFRTTYGYGQLARKGGVLVYAHRLSWEMNNGPIPDGAFILHECDNPPCVNPAHLKIGTPADNMRDASRRKRLKYGEGHPNSKLTVNQVEQIREMFAEGVTKTALAKRFSVSRRTVGFVIQKIWWKGV